MATVVNLRTARKARTKKAAKASATATAAKFGRTKAEKALESAREHKAALDLDGHRREPD